MRKVGIVTFFSNYNYGSVLQAFALAQFLLQKGYCAEIIDYQTNINRFNRRIRAATLLNRAFVFLVHPKIWKLTLRSMKNANKAIEMLPSETIKQFDTFIKNVLKPYSGVYHHYSDFDAFICGSDQIWQVSAPGLNKVFFLRFTVPQKRIAYAVSLGSIAIPKYNEKQFKRYVNSFHAVSVRESTSKRLIEDICNQEVTHVLDPTLLIGRVFWNDLISKIDGRRNYVLCYFLDECKDSDYIVLLAKNRNLQVLWIETGLANPNGSEKISPSPIEFISLIKHADFVFTDSFHACCFSFLFEKSFYVIRRNYHGYPAQHIRIEELLTMTKMTDRQLNYCTEAEVLEPISQEKYKGANRVFSEYRDRSAQFLENSLK